MMRQKKARLRMTIPVTWRSVQQGKWKLCYGSFALGAVKFSQHFRSPFAIHDLIIKIN